MALRHRVDIFPFVLGLIGTAGGVISLVLFSYVNFILNSSPSDIGSLIVEELAISVVLGLSGTTISLRRPILGGSIMLVGAILGSGALSFHSGRFANEINCLANCFGILSFTNSGWWSIDLLVGGMFVLSNSTSQQARAGSTDSAHTEDAPLLESPFPSYRPQLVLGLIGTMLGVVSLLELGLIFVGSSPSLHGENAPLLTGVQVTVLEIIAGSILLGLGGTIVSRWRSTIGSLLMLLGGGLSLGALIYSLPTGSDLRVVWYAAVSGWWAINFIVGGLFGIRTRR